MMGWAPGRKGGLPGDMMMMSMSGGEWSSAAGEGDGAGGRIFFLEKFSARAGEERAAEESFRPKFLENDRGSTIPRKQIPPEGYERRTTILNVDERRDVQLPTEPWFIGGCDCCCTVLHTRTAPLLHRTVSLFTLFIQIALFGFDFTISQFHNLSKNDPTKNSEMWNCILG